MRHLIFLLAMFDGFLAMFGFVVVAVANKPHLDPISVGWIFLISGVLNFAVCFYFALRKD